MNAATPLTEWYILSLVIVFDRFQFCANPLSPFLFKHYHKVKFPSNSKWQQKIDKKKQIYSDAMNLHFDYDKVRTDLVWHWSME